MLDYVREVLETLALATKQVAIETTMSIANAYVVFETLQETCEDSMEEFQQNIDSDIDVVWYTQLKVATEACLAKISTYYDNCGEKDAMIVPLLLHPKYGLSYIQRIWREHADWILSAEYEIECSL